jgi:arginase
MREADKYGIGRIMEETNDYLKNYDDIHLSYDIDALDPFYAPSTGTAVRGGLSFREGVYISEELYSTGKLSSMDLVEVNPSLQMFTNNDADRTIEMALKLIASSLGEDVVDRNRIHVH